MWWRIKTEETEKVKTVVGKIMSTHLKKRTIIDGFKFNLLSQT